MWSSPERHRPEVGGPGPTVHLWRSARSCELWRRGRPTGWFRWRQNATAPAGGERGPSSRSGSGGRSRTGRARQLSRLRQSVPPLAPLATPIDGPGPRRPKLIGSSTDFWGKTGIWLRIPARTSSTCDALQIFRMAANEPQSVHRRAASEPVTVDPQRLLLHVIICLPSVAQVAPGSADEPITLSQGLHLS